MASRSRERYKANMQRLYATNRKRAHAIINQGSQTRAQMTTLRDPSTQEALTKPENILQHTHEYYQKQAKPVTGPKRGRFLSRDVKRGYPWEHGPHKGLDSFALESAATKPEYNHRH